MFKLCCFLILNFTGLLHCSDILLYMLTEASIHHNHRGLSARRNQQGCNIDATFSIDCQWHAWWEESCCWMSAAILASVPYMLNVIHTIISVQNTTYTCPQRLRFGQGCVKQCKTCVMHAVYMHISALQILKNQCDHYKYQRFSWLKVIQNIFAHKGKSYLVTVCNFSDWIDIDELNDTHAMTSDRNQKAHCARHVVARLCHTDNGPQFINTEYELFA